MTCVRTTIFALTLATALGASQAAAMTTCSNTSQGRLCRAEVNFDRFSQEAYMNQMQSQWCWAASISMVFSYLGHPVSQARIVTDAYGAPANIPAGAGFVIARELNRGWRDDNGDVFTTRVTGVYDADAGVGNLTNQRLISELAGDQPVIIGSRSHAMVLTAIEYYETSAGPFVQWVGVFDPWPGVGARTLAADEMTPVTQGGSLRFLATIDISEGGTVSEPSSSSAGGCTLSPSHSVGILPMLGAAIALLAALSRRRTRAGATGWMPVPAWRSQRNRGEES